MVGEVVGVTLGRRVGGFEGDEVGYQLDVGSGYIKHIYRYEDDMRMETLSVWYIFHSYL
jgi:hypothetical protein